MATSSNASAPSALHSIFPVGGNGLSMEMRHWSFLCIPLPRLLAPKASLVDGRRTIASTSTHRLPSLSSAPPFIIGAGCSQSNDPIQRLSAARLSADLQPIARVEQTIVNRPHKRR